MKIQMVDTRNQYLKIKGEVDEAIEKVLDTAEYINGKIVKTFADNLSAYLNVKHTIPCANGTDALQIAMMALNLQPGDEVITPSFTYIATTEVIALLKLKPVFVEVDPDTFCIDPIAIEAAITSKTRAIVPVHLYGQSANMEAMLKIASKYNLFVIEDNAQAIGCDYAFTDGTTKKTGTIGTIGITSFYPSKNLGAFGDGGALFTNDEQLAKKLKMIANHGQERRYYHDVVGCNSRLDSIQAAILNIKLKNLDSYIAERQKVAKYYNDAFSNHDKIKTPFISAFSNHVFHQYTITLKGADQNGLKNYLEEQAIPSMIYYPLPAHRQKVFANLGGGDYDLPITDSLTQNVISLPIHTEMTEDELQYITYHVIKYLKE